MIVRINDLGALGDGIRFINRFKGLDNFMKTDGGVGVGVGGMSKLFQDVEADSTRDLIDRLLLDFHLCEGRERFQDQFIKIFPLQILVGNLKKFNHFPHFVHNSINFVGL